MGTRVDSPCDVAGRPERVELDDATVVREIAYDPTGQPKSFTYGNSLHTEIGDRGRTLSVSSPAIELVYAYDGADNVKRFDDQKRTGALRTMTYDRDDRLKTVDHATLGLSSYEYDPLGNRLWSPLAGNVSVRFEYDERNRLAWASQSLRPTALTLDWDHANRLVRSSDGATYRYDGHDRRVAKTEGGATTVYHHDAAGRVIAETLPDGTKLRDYVYLGDKLVAVDGCMEGAVASGCTLRQWYHTDTLGSVRARTDAEGTVVASFDYKPFGEQADVGGVAGPRQYNGRVYDAGTGFHDYGARLYWPEVGRFVSADSYPGNVANPQSVNRYAYVHNNPLRYVDPTGHYVMVTGARMEAALRELRSTPSGEALYVRLRDSKNIFRLQEGGEDADSRPDSEYDAVFGSRQGRGTGGTTAINFDKKFMFEDETGAMREASYSQVLAHELQHLANYDNGFIDRNPPRRGAKVTRAEEEAIRVENQVRKELDQPGERKPDGKVRIYDQPKR